MRYTFLICLFLKVFGKTPIVYLRSDGYGEYKAILGSLGKLIYHLMFILTSLISNLISCRKYILGKMKGQVVYPSQLDSVWFKKPKIQEVRNFQLLYVGRIKVEIEHNELFDAICNQIQLLIDIASKNNISFVKPHGALYNESVNDSDLSQIIVDAILSFDLNLTVVGLAGSKLIPH